MNTDASGRTNRKWLLVTLLLNIVAVGSYAFLFAEVKAKNEHSSNLVNEIEAEVTAKNVQHSTKALVVETSAFREKLKGYFVGKEEAVSFLELLERTGSEVGATVHIETVTPGVLPKPTAEELRLALKVTGTWPEVVRYIGLLESLPVQATVEQMTLSESQKDGDGPWLGEVTLVVLKEK